VSETEQIVEDLEHPGQALERVAEAHLPARDVTPAPGLLPGELRPHPSPFRYVAIAVVLVVVTAAEVWLSYLEGDMPDGLLIALLLVFAVLKFSMVAAWYMHLKTDKPIFARFFVLGIVAAVALYCAVLFMLHVLD
jgi:cytochrome c oxidase subunit 4